MKNDLAVLLLAVLAMYVGGCVFITDDGSHNHGGSSKDTTISEIDAVGKLSFGSERKAGYERIAGRKGLSRNAQVYLIEAVLSKLSFDNAKEEVLLKLIANPDFSAAAEREILNSIDRLAFESSKKKILKAISDRK